MDLGIRGKTAIVCGSSQGLGYACAMALAEEGVNIVMNSRDFDRIFAAARKVSERYGVETVPVAADALHVETPDKLVKAAIDRFGGLDILITNTGGPQPGVFADMGDDSWEQAFHLTLMSTVRMIRASLPPMLERGCGRIVNLASISVKQPIPGLLLSNSLRSAVVGMAKTLSQEVAARGVTINTIATGTFETERIRAILSDRAKRQGVTEDITRLAQIAAIPMGRLGRPEELASVAVFLASEKASYLTGTTIQVDGGMCMGIM